MKIHHYINRLPLILCVCIAFLMPFLKIVPILIALLTLYVILSPQLWKAITSQRKIIVCLLPMIMYIGFAVGMVHTKNTHAGWFDLEVKLGLFLFPLLMTMLQYSWPEIKAIFTGHIIGLFICSIYLLIRAANNQAAGIADAYSSQTLSHHIHPSYLAMYLDFAIALLLLGRLNGKYVLHNVINNWATFPVAIFFSLMVVMLASKIGIIVMVIIHLWFVITYLWRQRNIKLTIMILLCFAIASVVVLYTSPQALYRLSVAANVLGNDSIDKTTTESTGVRMLVWQTAVEVIANHWWNGVGTGDVSDVLQSEYMIRGMAGAYDHHLNAHNGWLQAGVALGIIGIVLLMASNIWPLIISIDLRHTPFLLFLVIIIANFAVESLLETQAGTVYYSFFYSLLCIDLINTKKITK